jgi:hypothetical protein
MDEAKNVMKHAIIRPISTRKATIVAISLSIFLSVNFCSSFLNSSDKHTCATARGATTSPSELDFDTLHGTHAITGSFDGYRNYPVRSSWSDGTFVYTCGSNYTVGLAPDVIVSKWQASDGAFVWARSYGMSSKKETGESIWGMDGFLYTTGETDQVGPNPALLLVKWNATTGAVVWNQTYGGGAIYAIGHSVWGAGNDVFAIGERYVSGHQALLRTEWNADTGAILSYNWWNATDRSVGYSVYGCGDFLYACGQSWLLPFASGGMGNTLIIKWRISDGQQLWVRTGEDVGEAGTASWKYAVSIWATDTAAYTMVYSFNTGWKEMLQKWSPSGSLLANQSTAGHSDYMPHDRVIWMEGENIYALVPGYPRNVEGCGHPSMTARSLVFFARISRGRSCFLNTSALE